MKVPEGFERYYPNHMCLLLMQTIYGLKQAARAFRRELNKALLDMLYKQSPADPCLHYCWTMSGLIVWLTWIDDCLIAGNSKGVKAAKEQMKQRFECDDVGFLTEYVGCKVQRNMDSIKFTQPVLLQSFVDEFGCKKGTQYTPADPRQVLILCELKSGLNSKDQTEYRSGVGKFVAFNSMVLTRNI